MKKQRKNTISREAAEKELPREENESRSKRPGNFEKRERPARKSSRDSKQRDDRPSYKSSERKATRAPRQEGADGKPQRRNTRPKTDAQQDDRPRFEKKDGDRKPKFEKRDGDFKGRDRKESGDRKPRFEKKEGGYNSADRKPREEKRDHKNTPGRDAKKRTSAGGGKDYFKNFDETNRKKSKEDFKVKKSDVDDIPPTTNVRNDEHKANRTSTGKRSFKEKFVKPEKRFTEKELIEEKMPLNKFVSRAGYCSRREAAELIKKGEVKVNGEVLKEPGYKVLDTDVVTYQDEDVTQKEKPVYLLLNKAKDYITTTDDPEGRKTVMDLFKDVNERIFPVGRLDRNTTGLLLLTNDGHLAQKLSHPKFESKKIYQVKLDKNLTDDHFDEIVAGLKLEDGQAQVDSLAFINPENKSEIGIEIHIGKNRIVRRIFEHLGYEVKSLDRVTYAGLTKKNLPRGKWRALTEQELVFLKHFK